MTGRAQGADSLAAETEAYQAMLEGHRRDPDDDELHADLLKARSAMQHAYLERQAQLEQT
jgi:hypothetical protein